MPRASEGGASTGDPPASHHAPVHSSRCEETLFTPRETRPRRTTRRARGCRTSRGQAACTSLREGKERRPAGGPERWPEPVWPREPRDYHPHHPTTRAPRPSSQPSSPALRAPRIALHPGWCAIASHLGCISGHLACGPAGVLVEPRQEAVRRVRLRVLRREDLPHVRCRQQPHRSACRHSPGRREGRGGALPDSRRAARAVAVGPPAAVDEELPEPQHRLQQGCGKRLGRVPEGAAPAAGLRRRARQPVVAAGVDVGRLGLARKHVWHAERYRQPPRRPVHRRLARDVLEQPDELLQVRAGVVRKGGARRLLAEARDHGEEVARRHERPVRSPVRRRLEAVLSERRVEVEHPVGVRYPDERGSPELHRRVHRVEGLRRVCRVRLVHHCAVLGHQKAVPVRELPAEPLCRLVERRAREAVQLGRLVSPRAWAGTETAVRVGLRRKVRGEEHRSPAQAQQGGAAHGF